jgi:uncharacterized membrane protein YtjA (UPF0391 family)
MGGYTVIRWALISLVVAIISGMVAFTGIAVDLAVFAQFIFFLALALFAIFLVVGLAIGKPR